MLTALTKTGKRISLGYAYKKDTLIYMRNTEEFLCPICKEPVILKLGDKRIYHFAHMRGGTCLEFYEPESQLHMEGKIQLYQWLIRQKIMAVLEYYDKEIQQRPDIMFEYGGHKYALEYQCSVIPEEIFIKRTNTYLQNGYIPLWIIANTHIQQNNSSSISLSSFHYLFLRPSLNGKYFIPTYCSEKQQFYLIQSLIPISTKNTIFQSNILPLENSRLDCILNPLQESHLNFKYWKLKVENYILNWSFYSGKRKNPFLQEIYLHHLNPFLLPSEIGLPVAHAIYIQTPPFIWQTYLFIDVFMGKHQNDTFTVTEISMKIKKRLYRKDLIMRSLPQLKDVSPMIPVMEYFRLLELEGIVKKISEETYQIQRKIVVPQSNRENEEAKKIFYQKSRPFLTNI
ncbi:hypothetical protein HPT25_13790 [Bacillus sp. BRMEA1]|uniref:competence protein CoiA n=1 Tax=Neobacillus endophyticus TaxID=2738405 RepID=UPI0015673D75|nr:competence protein CoiA family protein [Neobacillus endophyticus]NRD78440.1 hypothetical protein [Neobacillus endophyticus]